MATDPARQQRARSRTVWLGLIVIFVLAIAAAIILPNAVMTSMMRPSKAATPLQLKDAAPGQPVNLVLEITSVSNNEMRCTLLASQSRGVYSRTHTAVVIARDAATKTVMGSLSDLVPRGVIAVQGTVTGHSDDVTSVRSKRIVVLSGYATVR